MGEREKVRRILDVDVEEVSLVDRAANLRRFLVIKRLKEEQEMGAFDKKEIDVLKAIEAKDTNSIRAWLEKMADSEESPNDEVLKTVTAMVEELEKAAKAEAEKAGSQCPKCGAMNKADATECAKCGAPLGKAEKKTKAEGEAEVEKAMKCPKCGASNPVGSKFCNACGTALAEKAKGKGSEGDEYPDPKMKKDLDGVAVQVMDDGSVIVSGERVSKGKKFTASRTGTLKDVTMALMKLIGEVGDEETLKALVEAMKQLPTSPKWTQGVTAQGTGDSVKVKAKKSEDEGDEGEDTEKLKETIADLTKRLGKLEEARPAPSGQNDRGTDSKIEKGFWSGVL